MDKEERILERWLEFYEEKINNEMEAAHETDSTMSVKPIAEYLNIQEIEEVISRLRYNKTPGIDSIPADVFKYGCHRLIQSIHELVTWTWELEKLWSDWKMEIIWPIFKKGDK
ncbi:uncharacterized protein LOC142317709 [Lycorma delicatula]|uniref:uncharacterized protein LOC142317709 n=1 Tax=Lycorma delicatula TaxID=130591 RepID=UPI003F50DEBF